MDYYLLTARSITHVQQMAKALEHTGINAKIRRVGTGVTKSGCGYTLQVSERQYPRCAERLRAANVRPVRVLRVTGSGTQEVPL